MTTSLKRRATLVVALLAALFIAPLATTSPASASTTATAPIYHSYHLFNKLDTKIAANCPYVNRIYSRVGTATFSPPHDYKNILFYNEWVGNLHYVRYYQQGFTTAIVNLGCVNNDFVYMYYGYQMAYRIQYITYNCFGGGCTAAVSYSAWKYGWAVATG